MQSTQLTTSGFDLDKIFKINQQLSQRIYFYSQSALQQNNVFCLIGPTSAGKTTALYYLSCDQLKFEVEQKKKVRYVLPLTIFQDAIIEPTPVTVTSRSPNIKTCAMSSAENQNSSQKIILVQVPDIKALSQQQNTVENLFFLDFFKNYHKIHLIIVITESVLDSESEFMESIDCIINMFDISSQFSQSILSKSLSILVNKCEPSRQEDEIVQKLAEINSQIVEQQNKDLYKIIKEALDSKRIYIMHEAEPQLEKQKKLLSLISQNSEFNYFGSLNLKFHDLQNILADEKRIEQIIEWECLYHHWENSIKILHLLLSYALDQKSRLQLFDQVKAQMKGNSLTKHFQIQSIKPLESPLNQSIKSKILKCLKPAISNNSNDFTSMPLPFFCEKFSQIQKQIQELMTGKRDQEQKKNESIPKQSFLYFFTLKNAVSQCCCILDYVNCILDFQPESEQQKSILSKQCLYAVSQRILFIFQQQFASFNLGLLASKQKEKSGKKKPKKNQIITIFNLRTTFLNQVKTQKKNLLQSILLLPNTSFKMLLLCMELPKNIQTDFDKNFCKNITILREISLILQLNNLFIEEICFLLLIPDWNKVQQIIDRIEKSKSYFQNMSQEDKSSHFQFLIKLGAECQQRARTNLNKKIEILLNSCLKQTKLKQDQNNLMDSDQTVVSDWLISKVAKLYQINRQNSPPPVVQKVEAMQEQFLELNSKINRLLFLMSHCLTKI